MSRVAAIFKVGDKVPADNKLYMSLKEGSLVEIIDEADWTKSLNTILAEQNMTLEELIEAHQGMSEEEIVALYAPTLEDIISEHMRTVFAVVEVDLALVPYLVSTYPPLGVVVVDEKQTIPDTTAYRARNKLLPLTALATLLAPQAAALGILDLEAAWRGKDEVPILDAKKLTTKAFVDASTVVSLPTILDRNAVSSGSYTVGSGKNYATWTTAFADIANLTGDLTFTQQTDLTMTSVAQVTEDLGGYTLKCTLDVAHLGIQGDGWVTSISSTLNVFQFLLEGPGNLVFENLELVQITDSSSWSFIYFTQVDASFYGLFRNLIFDCASLRSRAWDVGDSTPILDGYNWIIIDSTGSSVFCDNGHASNKLENITVINAGNYGFDLDSRAGTCRNCASAFNDNNDDFGNNGSADGYNNASDDSTAQNSNWSTGSGNITGLVAGDFFHRYKIDRFSACHKAGSNPTISGHTEYINGADIIPGAVDIGAWGVSTSIPALFIDGFTEGSNTDLDAHTPDRGSGWGILVQTGGAKWRVVASTDLASPTGSFSNYGVLYTADLASGSYDDNQWCEMWLVDAYTSIFLNCMAVRASDADNMYLLRFNDGLLDIYKNVAGSWSLVATGSGVSDYQFLAFEAAGNILRVHANHKIILRVEDDSLTSGKPGFGGGKVATGAPGNQYLSTSQMLDMFSAGDGSYLGRIAFYDRFDVLGELSTRNPNKGLSWTQVYQGTSGYLSAIAGEICEPPSLSNDGALYTCDISGGIDGANYRIGYKVNISPVSEFYWYLVVRYQDNNNYYALQVHSTLCQLYKVVAGVWTAVDSNFSVVANQFIELEIDGTTLTAYINGTAKASGTVTDFAAAGKPALGAGNLRVASGDLNTSYDISKLRVVNLPDTPAPPAQGDVLFFGCNF